MSTVAQALAPLNAELSLLTAEMIEIKRLAGNRLENFSRLSPRNIRGFERSVRAFWRSYAKAVREATDLTGPGIAINVQGLRTFYREFEYKKEAKPHSYLGSVFEVSPGSTEFAQRRIMVAARMCWLRSQPKNSKGDAIYPAQEELHYMPLNMDRDFLLQNLDRDLKWLVDWTVVPSWEMAVFITHVDNLMGLRRDWDNMLTDIMDFVAANGLKNVPKVHQFTTLTTEEAMRFQTEDGDKATCDICGYTFGTEQSEENMTEPAVKTRCGHVLGSACLQNWVDSGHATCPSCRQAMYGMELALPPAVMHHYNAVIHALKLSKRMDKALDTYLLQGNKEVHDANFTEFVHRLSAVGYRLHSQFATLYERIQIEASMLDVGGESSTDK